MGSKTFTALLHLEDDLYVAECPEVGTVSQGPKIEEAISTFAEIQEVLLKPNGMNFLKNSHVIGKLQKVVASAPPKYKTGHYPGGYNG